MRQLLALILTLGFLKADTASIAAEVSAIPQGVRIDVRLKSKEKLRGVRGPSSDTGFTLVNRGADREIAFDDVASVKLYKSHTTRNVLIIVAISVVATLGIIAAVAIRCAPLGCNAKL